MMVGVLQVILRALRSMLQIPEQLTHLYDSADCFVYWMHSNIFFLVDDIWSVALRTKRPVGLQKLIFGTI